MSVSLGLIPVSAMQIFYFFCNVFDTLYCECQTAVISRLDLCNIFWLHERLDAASGNADISGQIRCQGRADIRLEQRNQFNIHYPSIREISCSRESRTEFMYAYNASHSA